MKITCTRPNASEEINGIPFTRQKDGSVVATGVSVEDAEAFANFEGYTVEVEKELAQTGTDLPDASPAISSSARELPSDTAPVDVAVSDVMPADALTNSAAESVVDASKQKPKK